MLLHEVTLTDYVVLRVLERLSNCVELIAFTQSKEARTGADLEIWISDHLGKYVGFRIQCKKANSSEAISGLHYRLKSGKYQSEILIRGATKVPGLLPLYWIYMNPSLYTQRLRLNPCYNACLDSRTRSRSMVGIWCVSAFIVNMARPENKIASLKEFIWPWHCILCCNAKCCYAWAGLPELPSAETVIERARQRSLLPPKDYPEITLVDELPDYVQLAREGNTEEAWRKLVKEEEDAGVRYALIVNANARST